LNSLTWPTTSAKTEQTGPFKIFYTGRAGSANGPYEVCFTRDNNDHGADSTVRNDRIVNGRSGFNADRLI
jgi:hypothetical protein